MQESKMMQANKAPEIQIKETDKDFYHIEFKRILVDTTGKYPITTLRVQTYSRKEYAGFTQWAAKYGIKACGDDEMRVVHDPTVEVKAEVKEVKRPVRKRTAKKV